jgi:hypothetical protein
MSRALDAYKRAFHCGVGGHDGHPEDEEVMSPDDQAWADRCALAADWSRLCRVLREISVLPDGQMNRAREIASKAIMEK